MTLAELVTVMVAQGIRLSFTPDGLLCAVAPSGKLTPEISAALKSNRDAVAMALGIAVPAAISSVQQPFGSTASSTALVLPSMAEATTFPPTPCLSTDANKELPVQPSSSTERQQRLCFGSPRWKVDYHLVETHENFRRFLLRFGRQRRFAIDLETTSLDPTLARIVGYSVCWQPGEAWYLPVHAPEGEPHLDYEVALQQLRPILEDPDVAKVNQNIKYDLLVLRHHGVRVAGVKGDSMVADYLLRAGERGHGLGALALHYPDYCTIPITDLIGKKGKNKSQLSMAQVSLEKITPYACEDADMALRLGEMLEDRLHRQGLGNLCAHLEVPLIEVLVEMESNGIRIDVPLLERLSQEMSTPLAELKKEIHGLAGYEFNIGSTKQLRRVLYDEMKLPILAYTKSKESSTNAEVLAKLAKLGHELPKKLQEHRTLAKLKSTYVDALPKLVSAVTGRLHTSFNQAVTATGRLSSSNPNLQNIPARSADGRRIRQAFLPSEGWLLLKADYSQIELRILAHFSGDAELLRAYREDRDIHTLVASQCFRVPEEAVTSDQRRFAKTINFGVIYGMSAHGLAKRLESPKEEAGNFIDAYFARYPAVAGYQDELLNQCRLKGFASTLLGRRRYLQGVRLETSYRDRNESEREAVNMQIQGSAADLIKMAMVNVYRRLRREQRRARMLLTVHDELVFDVPPEELQAIARLVTEEMEQAMALAVPIKVELAAGPNWLDVEKI